MTEPNDGSCHALGTHIAAVDETSALDGAIGAPRMKQVVEIPQENHVFGASIQAFDLWQYAPAVRAGGLLFIAGTVGIRPDGTVPASVAEQTELAFERIAEILRLEGLSATDLVEVVSYHVAVKENLEEFLPIKTKFFQHPLPTWTLLGVEALGLPELKIEIKCVAALKA